MGEKDPRDLDSLGLARAQPGRSVAENEVPLWSLSAGDTAGWTLSWSSGSPPFNGWSLPKKGRRARNKTERKSVREKGLGRGRGSRPMGSLPRSRCLQTGLLFLTAKTAS